MSEVMRIKKRSGNLEVVDLNKIVTAITRHATGLTAVEPMRVAVKTIGGLYDGATTSELDHLSIQTAAALTAEEPEYSRLAARLLLNIINKEVAHQDISSFSQAMTAAFGHKLVSEKTKTFVAKNARKLNAVAASAPTDKFEYFGLKTLYDRYFLKHPTTRAVIETPVFFYLRIACGLADTVQEAIDLFTLYVNHRFMHGTPTLLNSGTTREQMSSCFLVDSPKDDLKAIYKSYADVAMLSKYSGGIGIPYHRVRSRKKLIRGTNGYSSGIVPFIKTQDSSIAAVDQGGSRKGAAAIYLATEHPDLEEFLELRYNTGDVNRRTYNLNLVNWLPDLFLRRVEADGEWSFMDPDDVPGLCDLYGDAYEAAYVEAEKAGKATKTVKARDLYGKMIRTLCETGQGWMTFKDPCNLKCNQTGEPQNVVHSSNLCVEITEVSDENNTAVCNIGSHNLEQYTNNDGTFDYPALAIDVRTAVVALDKVIDRNFYTIPETKNSNLQWRPIGLGLMGLQDVFFKLGYQFESPEALKVSTKIQEEIYFNALDASCELAKIHGPHPTYAQTRIAKEGKLQFDLWGITPTDTERWDKLRERIKKYGLRNSLLIAIAPTATIASIVGCYECIEPQVSNLFKRETLSGEFLQVNKYLVADLKKLGMWTEDTRNKIKLANGSVQTLDGFPDNLKKVYKTVWEIPQKTLIDMAAARGAFVDQSQSLNLFMAEPNVGRVASMIFYAWKKGLKTTYYLRSRPVKEIKKATVSSTSADATEAVTCSLDNREACEVCQ